MGWYGPQSGDCSCCEPLGPPCVPCTRTPVIFTVEFEGFANGGGYECTNCEDLNQAFELNPVTFGNCGWIISSVWLCDIFIDPSFDFNINLGFSGSGPSSYIHVTLNRGPIDQPIVFSLNLPDAPVDCTSFDRLELPLTVNVMPDCVAENARCFVTSGTL